MPPAALVHTIEPTVALPNHWLCGWEENDGGGKRSSSVQTLALEGSLGIHSPVILDIFTRTALRKESLTAQGDFSKIIDVVGRIRCFLSV